MPNFEIPTDNLYKFCAILGLLITLFFGALPKGLSFYISFLTIDFKEKSEIWKSQVEYYTKEISDNTKDAKSIVEKYNQKKQSISEDEFKSDLVRALGMDKYMQKASAYNLQVRLTMPKVIALADKIILFSKIADTLNRVSIFATVLGLAIMFYGFLGWRRIQISAENQQRQSD